MQKIALWMAFVFALAINLKLTAQYAAADSTYKKHFIGSTLFLLGNLAPVNPPGFAQLNFGYRISNRDVLSLEMITWKYGWPLGINPFYNPSYGKPETQFPGSIREYGIGLAYQRYLWKGLYLALHATPMLQIFRNEGAEKIGNGFHLFNTYRIGYHLKLFKDRCFLQPSIGIAGRPFRSQMPDAFQEKDDQWPKWTPEPGLHFGINF